MPAILKVTIPRGDAVSPEKAPFTQQRARNCRWLLEHQSRRINKLTFISRILSYGPMKDESVLFISKPTGIADNRTSYTEREYYSFPAFTFNNFKSRWSVFAVKCIDILLP